MESGWKKARIKLCLLCMWPGAALTNGMNISNSKAGQIQVPPVNSALPKNVERRRDKDTTHRFAGGRLDVCICS